jgi:DNA-directed RNA polymerase specialized sigma24 family protein
VELQLAARLVLPPRGTRPCSNAELVAIARALILCPPGVERQVLVLRDYHRFKMSRVARELGITLARAVELYEGVQTRLRAALVQRDADDKLARWTKLDSRQPAASAGGKDLQ